VRSSAGQGLSVLPARARPKVALLGQNPSVNTEFYNHHLCHSPREHANHVLDTRSKHTHTIALHRSTWFSSTKTPLPYIPAVKNTSATPQLTNNTAHPPNNPQLPHRQRPPIHLPHPLFPLHPPQRPFLTSKRPTHPTRSTHAKSPASTRNPRLRDITPRPCCPRF
jgi:hypothetical protein